MKAVDFETVAAERRVPRDPDAGVKPANTNKPGAQSDPALMYASGYSICEP
jgi:hypothetical protein